MLHGAGQYRIKDIFSVAFSIIHDNKRDDLQWYLHTWFNADPKMWFRYQHRRFLHRWFLWSWRWSLRYSLSHRTRWGRWYLGILYWNRRYILHNPFGERIWLIVLRNSLGFRFGLWRGWFFLLLLCTSYLPPSEKSFIKVFHPYA